jgi:hypothetical protein
MIETYAISTRAAGVSTSGSVTPVTAGGRDVLWEEQIKRECSQARDLRPHAPLRSSLPINIQSHCSTRY